MGVLVDQKEARPAGQGRFQVELGHQAAAVEDRLSGQDLDALGQVLGSWRP
nr:hypothetical protein [Geminicoccus harenae]